MAKFAMGVNLQMPARSKVADDLCKKWEGYEKKLGDGTCTAYPDPGPTGEPITIGFGTTYYSPGTAASKKYGVRPVRWGDILTLEEAEECFKTVMDERERLVNQRLTAPVTQAMFDALISFYYNLSPSAWPEQINRCNAGNYEECADSFKLYRFAQKKVLQGLINRRADEEALFRSEGLKPNGASPSSATASVALQPQADANANIYRYAPLDIPWHREDNYMVVGDQNDDVVELRRGLIGLGFLPNSGYVSDYFDNELAEAVRKFQNHRNIKVDGKVGDDTAEQIELNLAEVRGEVRRNRFDSKHLDNIKYFSQWDNDKDKEPGATCGNTSVAMSIFERVGVTPDEIYIRFGKKNGQDSGLIATVIYSGYGLTGKFKKYADLQDIRNVIDAGVPVVVQGWFTSPGHIVCVVGYNSKGLIVHDPAGVWNGQRKTSYSSSNKNGKNRVYSYANLSRVGVKDGEVFMAYAEP